MKTSRNSKRIADSIPAEGGHNAHIERIKGGIVSDRRRFNPHRVFHSIKFYAVEIGATLVFLSWVIKEVRHQLGF